MDFNIISDVKSINCENIFLCSISESLETLIETINEKLAKENNLDNTKNEKGELYYVYGYTPQKVYVTKQGSNKVELLEGVTDEFKKNLAEGFILRYKDGKFAVDEMFTEKSMNFELDFDNYKE